MHSCMITQCIKEKIFCRHCLQASRKAEQLKCRITDCFKINDKQGHHS